MLKIVEKLKAKARALFARKPTAAPKIEAVQVEVPHLHERRPQFSGGTRKGARHTVNPPGTKVARAATLRRCAVHNGRTV